MKLTPELIEQMANGFTITVAGETIAIEGRQAKAIQSAMAFWHGKEEQADASSTQSG